MVGLSKEISEHMARTKSKNSKAELLVFNNLRKNGIYFQKHYSRAPGRPDIAVPRKKKAIFIDGDFWHGHKFNRTLELRGPDDYWTLKIARNMERDKMQASKLIDCGWQFLRVWESDILRKKTRDDVLVGIRNFLLKP
jgi:DNA mismatch endonuclease, patch repair protein